LKSLVWTRRVRVQTPARLNILCSALSARFFSPFSLSAKTPAIGTAAYSENEFTQPFSIDCIVLAIANQRLTLRPWAGIS